MELSDPGVVELDSAVRRGIEEGEWSLIESWMVRHCTFSYNDRDALLEAERLPGQVVNHLLGLIQSPSVVTNPGSHHLFRIIEYEWGTLTQSQRTAYREAFETVYCRLADWTSQFLIVEILGEFECNAEAFESLDRLIRVASGAGRQLLPMGLGHFISNSHDIRLADRATARLSELAHDSDALVRAEALDVLARHGLDGKPTRKSGR